MSDVLLSRLSSQRVYFTVKVPSGPDGFQSWLPVGYSLIPEFDMRYKLGKKLDRGSFGFVLQVTRRSDGKQFAVKFLNMNFRRIWPKHPVYGRVPKEYALAMKLRHKNIIKPVDAFWDDRYFYVVRIHLVTL